MVDAAGGLVLLGGELDHLVAADRIPDTHSVVPAHSGELRAYNHQTIITIRRINRHATIGAAVPLCSPNVQGTT